MAEVHLTAKANREVLAMIIDPNAFKIPDSAAPDDSMWRSQAQHTAREKADAIILLLATLDPFDKFVQLQGGPVQIAQHTIEECAKIADAVQSRMRDECDFGAGIAAREIRALAASPPPLLKGAIK